EAVISGEPRGVSPRVKHVVPDVMPNPGAYAPRLAIQGGFMSFRPVFIAVLLAGALIIAAFLIHSWRPREVVDQPTAALVRASGGCAQCHSNMQYSVVHEY